jgi:hypothetical protein
MLEMTISLYIHRIVLCQVAVYLFLPSLELDNDSLNRLITNDTFLSLDKEDQLFSNRWTLQYH